MSPPILPLEAWISGTNENSLPANENWLRLEALSRMALSDSVTVQPSSPDDRALYIIPLGATGVQWSTFDADDLALYVEPVGGGIGTWKAWAPVDGIIINLAGALMQYSGSSGWINVGGGGGIPDAFEIDYDNTSSGLGATNVQDAIDEIASGTSDSAVTDLSISSGVVNIDCSLGDYFTLELTEDVTSITFSNLPAPGRGASKAIRIRQDSTGGWDVTFPSSFKEISGSDTVVQPAANVYTILMITSFDQGTRWEYSMRAGS